MKHNITKEIKYHYVMRYLNGESPSKLGREIDLYSNRPKEIIYRWTKKFQSEGIAGLEYKTGKAPKKRLKKEKINYDNLSREELLEILRVQNIYIDEMNKIKRKRDGFNIVEKIKKKGSSLSIEKLLLLFDLSRSGYYKWKKNPRIDPNFNQEWLKKIQDIYIKSNKVYGATKIHGELRHKFNITLNIKTVKRYMRYLGIKSIIRNSSKNKREIKDTKDIRRNYFKKNFKDDASRDKLFSDSSKWDIPNTRIYFSAVVNCSGRLLDIKVSFRNDTELVTSNIEDAIKKVGKNTLLKPTMPLFISRKRWRI